ncbi:MAG: GDP-mannose 4,6-dehydratase [Gemmataceae bacterium]|nr:GDP-mannose 4,6-dehydratase [Gemmataceae bacterium]MDW8264857.1 GDP-mannose 4,6-dehydratase [Gemmataceae bacterium]
MRCLVTGAAGFIGSHLCDSLLQAGHAVVGIDAFIPYYPRPVKEGNLLGLWAHHKFVFHELDLRTAPLEPLLDGIDVVFHLAAMPGLPRSWSDFDLYESCNVTATQRLVEAAVRQRQLHRFIYASTSSVYGRYASGDESLPTRPISPYGVTKLAAEHLCRAFCEEKGLPLVVLRYFSVYGPRQRPDMAYHRFIRALLAGAPIVVHGDGQQVRGNTYVGDCVAATMAAMQALPGEIYNVGGGEAVTIQEVLHKLQLLTGRRAAIRHEPARPGDQRATSADTSKLRRHLGWRPRVGLDEGLARQLSWQRGEEVRLAA